MNHPEIPVEAQEMVTDRMLDKIDKLSQEQGN
jgi:hypothetical protein